MEFGEALVAIIAILSVFVLAPGMVIWAIGSLRRQGSLRPGDEKMLEDLWRSAKAMERRIETLESLVERDDSRRRGDDRDQDDTWRN